MKIDMHMNIFVYAYVFVAYKYIYIYRERYGAMRPSVRATPIILARVLLSGTDAKESAPEILGDLQKLRPRSPFPKLYSS